ncbi:MAG TPA: SpoIIE family protein phosphatase [Gammaproteobacteria bacterium]|mgnify:CR=1 FL=1|nr:SpoIIE family protein phosphatase [Gammaproteobacteria bacterium]
MSLAAGGGADGYTEGELAAMLAELTQDFASSLDVEETLQHAVDQIIRHLHAEAASIFLLDDARRALVCRKCAGPVDITGLRLQRNEGIVGESVRTGRVQIVRDVSEHASFAAGVDEGTGFVTRSILCAPLTVRGETIGALELMNKRSGDGLFAGADLHLATTVAAAAALAIHNARMAAALVEQERVRKELELAREIQLSLLPAGLDAGLPIRGVNLPAREVSGDFYDYFRLPDGRLYFSIADVAGKGMNAALLMAKTTSLLRCLAKRVDDPGELLSRVNDEICETASLGMFVTIVAGFLDPRTRRIALANGGHLPPLQRAKSGRYTELPPQMPPLGIVAGLAYPTDTLVLDGGCVYLFTDGLTESLDGEGRQLGLAGLRRLLDEVAETPADLRLLAVVTELEAAGRRFNDDITMLLIELEPPLLSLRIAADPRELAQIRTIVQEAAEAAGCGAKCVADIVMAVNEACMNIIQHAYKGDPAGTIDVEMRRDGEALEVWLRDHAPVVDPDDIKPRPLEELRPGGLGTFFIRAAMDDCTYGNLGACNGNYVRMTKRIVQ